MPSRTWLKDVDDATRDPVRWAFLSGAHLLEAGKASLLLRDGSTPTLVVAASIGIEPDIVPSIRVPIGKGIAGKVAERGALLFGARQSVTFISAPIITTHGVEGVLNLTNRLRGKQYGDEHVGAARALADHIAHLLAYRRYALPDGRADLPNRQAFGEALERELARSKRVGAPFSLALVELTNAASIAERLGPAKTEEVVRLVGGALEQGIRRYDFVSRYGPYTLALFLSGPSNPESGIERRISGAVEGVAKRVDSPIQVGIGLTHCPTDGISAHDLLTSASSRLAGETSDQHATPTG